MACKLLETHIKRKMDATHPFHKDTKQKEKTWFEMQCWMGILNVTIKLIIVLCTY